MDKHEEIARDVASRVGHIAVYDKRVQVVKTAIRAAVAGAVEAEREKCAVVASRFANLWRGNTDTPPSEVADDIVAAIRARAAASAEEER